MTNIHVSLGTGYDPGFLSVAVPFPFFKTGRVVRELSYTHFTVLQDPVRRLPAATGVNVDGTALVEIDRARKWSFDPRLRESEQAGDDIYADNKLDRGHQVRRRDPVWGPEAKAANLDTFVFTNAAPQAAVFNQGKQLWVGLEDHVLAYAKTTHQRISVFTGPVLSAVDPAYRGIAIPLLFWKVAVWATTDAEHDPILRSAAFVLDQSPFLDASQLAEAAQLASAKNEVPPLGPYRTYQVAVRSVATLTGLELDQLEAADVLGPVAPAARTADRRDWHELQSATDITV